MFAYLVLCVGVLEPICQFDVFLWSDFELQKFLQRIVFIKNSLYLQYLCKSFKFQFVTFLLNYLWIDWLSMSDFFLDFCCFSLFIILTTWKIYIFTFWTVRAIAKARKIVQISICVFDLQWYVYVILSKIKMTVSFLKECCSFSGVSLYLWWCIVEKK